MSKKLTKEDLEKKKKYHEKKASFYKKKIEKVTADEKRIGFKFY